jgi:hypothetical protein
LVGLFISTSPAVVRADELIIIKDDQFSPTIDITSKSFSNKTPTDNQEWVLVGQKDRKSGLVTVFVQFGNVYEDFGWRNYFKASTDSVDDLKLTKIRSNVVGCPYNIGCTYSETVNLYIDPKVLKNYTARNLKIKIFAQNGINQVIELPSDLLAEFKAKTGI